MSKAKMSKVLDRMVAVFGDALEHRVSRTGNFIDTWLVVETKQDVLRLVEFFTQETKPNDTDPKDCRQYWQKVGGTWKPKRFPGNRTPKANNRKRLVVSYKSCGGPVEGARTWLVDASMLLRDGSHGLLSLFDYAQEMADDKGKLGFKKEFNFRICLDDRIWAVIDQGVPRTLADMLEVKGLGAYAKPIGTAANNAIRLLGGDSIGSGNGKAKLDLLDGQGHRELLAADVQNTMFKDGVLARVLEAMAGLTLPKSKSFKAVQLPWVVLGLWDAIVTKFPSAAYCKEFDDTGIEVKIPEAWQEKLLTLNDAEATPKFMLTAYLSGNQAITAAVSAWLLGTVDDNGMIKGKKTKFDFTVKRDKWQEFHATWSSQFEVEDIEEDVEDDAEMDKVAEELAASA